MVLVEVVDRMSELRVADVVPALLVMARVAGIVGIPEPMSAHFSEQRPARGKLLGEGLRGIGQYAVGIAPPLLSKFAHHRVIEVRLRLPGIDLRDRCVGRMWVYDHRRVVPPVRNEHRQIRGLAALRIGDLPDKA